MKLINRVTFDEVKNSKSDTVYYSTRTFWWTDDPNDLQQTKPLATDMAPKGSAPGFGGGLPCDIFGCVLFQIEKSKWIGDVEKIKSHYGGLDIFMAMHHKNFTPEIGDPIKMFADKQSFIDAVSLRAAWSDYQNEKK